MVKKDKDPGDVFVWIINAALRIKKNWFWIGPAVRVAYRKTRKLFKNKANERKVEKRSR